MQAQNTTGATPLHDAASRGHSQVVRVLLLAGARAEPTDQVGAHMVLSQPPLAALRKSPLSLLRIRESPGSLAPVSAVQKALVLHQVPAAGCSL